MPFAASLMSLTIGDDEELATYQRVLFIPTLLLGAIIAGLILVLGEGAICFLILLLPFTLAILLALTIFYVVLARRIRSRKSKGTTLAAAILLPFAFAAIEARYYMPVDARSTTASIVVEAPATLLFDQLAEVPTIQPGEDEDGLFQKLGVPRPIRATVDRAALGGKRTGVFTEGLTFDETISAFEKPRRMSFTIAVDPTKLRPGSAERHAFETGYFRFVDATYELEELGPHTTRLSLTSRYELRSGANAYGALWADAVVDDFQVRVVRLLKQRAAGLHAATVASAR